MKETVHPTFGNLVVAERPDSVVLRLRTNRDGDAVFTYREIGVLAGLLAGIKAPVANTLDEDDLALLG